MTVIFTVQNNKLRSDREIEIDARLISIPEDFRYNLSESKYEKDDITDQEEYYNFKNRLKSAKKIPGSFISVCLEGGYIVLSKKRRDPWSYEASSYNVYKTNRGVWICTCADFSRFLKPCKHIIRVILYVHRQPDERLRLDTLISTILNSPRSIVSYRDEEFIT